jgi:hypothetical protein
MATVDATTTNQEMTMTNEQINGLMREAGEAGDIEMVFSCAQVLRGGEGYEYSESYRQVLRALSDAAAHREA